MTAKLLAELPRRARVELHLHWRAVAHFFRRGLPYLAQAVAFQALLSFVPFLLLVISFWGHFIGDDRQATARVNDALRLVFPFAAPRINASLADLIANRSLYTAISLVALLYLAGSVFRTIDHSINLAFGTADKLGPLRAQIKGILLVFLFGILIGLWSLSSSLIAVLIELMPRRLAPELSVYEGYASAVVLPMLLWALLFALLYHVLPHVEVPWRDAVRGGVLTALLWQLAFRLFGYVLTRTLSYNLVSGTVAAVVAFLLWIYYGACIFLYGAALVATLGERRRIG